MQHLDCYLLHSGFHMPLKWRHNERDGVSNHEPHDCLLNSLFKAKIKETSKLRATGLCEGNSPVTGEFPAQRASNAEKVSTWWRHHGWETLFVTCTHTHIYIYIWYIHYLFTVASKSVLLWAIHFLSLVLFFPNLSSSYHDMYQIQKLPGDCRREDHVTLAHNLTETMTDMA